MQTSLKCFFLLLILILLSGCPTHIKPEKFEINSELLAPFKSNDPIQVIVPTNAETEYLIEYSGKFAFAEGSKFYINLNDLYQNAKEQITEVLADHKIPITPGAKKHLKFSITLVQWDKWASGPMRDAYLEFDIETGDGYKKHYRVHDQSFRNVERAVSGTTSRAVEQIFQDKEILSYIESY